MPNDPTRRKRGRPADPNIDRLLLAMAHLHLRGGIPADRGYSLAKSVIKAEGVRTLDRRRVLNTLRNRWREPKYREKFLILARQQRHAIAWRDLLGPRFDELNVKLLRLSDSFQQWRHAFEQMSHGLQEAWRPLLEVQQVLVRWRQKNLPPSSR